MKIEVTQDKLAKALNNVSRIAVGKVTLPILNNVLIRVDNGKVSLVTTNLDMAIVDFLPVSSSEDGVITVPAKLLAEFISNLPRDEKVTISTDDTKVTINSGKYTSTINGSLADDFPELPEISEDQAVIFKIGIDEFKNSVNQVAVAASRDLARPALTGVFFNVADKVLSLAATDGYRLTEKQLIKDVQSEVSVVVPATSLQEVLRSLGDDMEEVELSFNDDLVRFRLGEVEIISKLIDASYPDYRKLIPKDSEASLAVDRAELLRVAKLAALFARRTANGAITVEAKAPDTLSVKSVATELGENDSIITTEVTKDDKINLNSRFFIDALNVLDDPTISLQFSPTGPLILRNSTNSDYTHIVMPLNH